MLTRLENEVKAPKIHSQCVVSDLISKSSPATESRRPSFLIEEATMKKHNDVVQNSANERVGQRVRVDTDHVPECLRPALQSGEVKKVTNALTETLQDDPREPSSRTPVASPGAPYRRRKSND
jgi:hypothetical protein